MEDVEFSEEFCRFLQTSIPRMDAAELLLLYRARPEAGFTADEAVRRLGPGVNLRDTAKYLELFEARGLLVRQDSGYRYRPESDLASQVDKLALAFNHRPVTLVRVIYALRDSGIQSFADAFRLRK